MSIVQNTKVSFFEMSVETRVMHLVMPFLVMLLLFVGSFAIGSRTYLSIWLLFLTLSILAEAYSIACEKTFNEKYKQELDKIIKQEIMSYGGHESVERDFWKSVSSRQSLRGIVPNEMIDSSLMLSRSFWGKVGALGMFVVVGLPMIVLGFIVYTNAGSA